MNRKLATKFYEITHWIDPYGNPEIDSKAIIDSLEEDDYDESLKELHTYITEGYEDVEELSKDKQLIKLLADLYKEEENGTN